MTPLKLGLDLDGVFVDFNRGFMTVLAHQTRDLTPHPYVEPSTWAWPKGLGYRASEVDQAWRTVDTTPFWWLMLQAYDGAAEFLTALDVRVARGEIEVYFLTTRGSPNAHRQSVEWVSAHGLEHPQVIVCKNAESKGQMCQILRLDAYVDDYVENLKAARAMNANLVLGCYTQPWNQDVALPSLTHRIGTYDALMTQLQTWGALKAL